jgi:WD40 repeat protein
MSRPLALATSSNGSRAAIGTSSGRIYTINVNDPASLQEVNNFGGNQVRAMDFSPSQYYLAAGLLDGSVKVLSGDGRRTIANLFGPGARVSAIEFSPDGRFLVAASNDGNVYLWNTMKWDDPPLVFTENNGFVQSLCFNRNGNYFYSGSVDYPRMVGRPTDPDKMAADFCSLLIRNLTPEEWTQYYGEYIPYQETCPR